MKKLNAEILNQKIEEIARWDFEQKKVFGSAYWVCQNGKVVCEKYFGETGIESGVPVTEKTIFRLASMTKPVTAVAALILIDRGLITLSDPVSKFLPEWDNVPIIDLKDGKQTVLGLPQKPPTVMNLLTHTSGIGSNDEKRFAIPEKDLETVDSTLEYLRKNGLDFEPGEKASYSAYGAFDVMVKIIETVTGESFHTFLKREIFNPCHMSDTAFIPTEEQKARIIKMHHRVNEECIEVPLPESCIFCNVPYTHPLGGAGLFSTMADYSAFAEMLLNQGTIHGNTIVSKETFALMPTPHIPAAFTKKDHGWGLGVRTIEDKSYQYLPIGTFGWSGAWGAHFWVDPVNGIAAVFLKNSHFDGGSGTLSGKNFEKAVFESLEN